MFDITFFAAIGFLFAAYAVVGNDALQTLGTFIASNNRLHWFWLFLFAATILVVTFTYGWMINDGDPSYGRLANVKKYPVVDIQWYHTLPPLVLVIITRFGVPVSTSFMVLTVFATIGGLSSMLQKSLIGYGLAFAIGLAVYLLLANTLEKFFKNTEHQQHHPIWVMLQWLTTGYLWSVWLIQDFANIFVFLPRQLSAVESFTAMFAIVALLAYTFANKGGPVQRILKTKTAVSDIRSATVIDFIYASLLFYFKELNNIPDEHNLCFSRINCRAGIWFRSQPASHKFPADMSNCRFRYFQGVYWACVINRYGRFFTLYRQRACRRRLSPGPDCPHAGLCRLYCGDKPFAYSGCLTFKTKINWYDGHACVSVRRSYAGFLPHTAGVTSKSVTNCSRLF